MSPRSKQFRKLVSPPVLKGFKPIGVSFSETNIVSLLYEEYEALRLVDYSRMKQEESAKLMNVSRPTFTRIYNSCLQKLARAFAEGKSIVIEGGDVEFDKQWYRCHECTVVYHSDSESQNCINCNSEDIEHINQSIKDWKQDQKGIQDEKNSDEFCICPTCDYTAVRQPGTPCFSLTCPNCKSSLIRKES